MNLRCFQGVFLSEIKEITSQFNLIDLTDNRIIPFAHNGAANLKAFNHFFDDDLVVNFKGSFHCLR